MASSSGGGSEDLSTSSDENVQVGNRRSRNKRDRKFYRPEDDDELFDLEESEDYSCSSENSSGGNKGKSHKRRKSTSITTEEGGDSDVAESYDEDEIALQQAIALSMAETDTGGEPSRRASNREAGTSSAELPVFDAEDAAMKQAMAYSLSEAGGELDEQKLRGRIKSLEIATNPQCSGKQDARSPALTINNKSVSTGKEKQSRKQGRSQFPSPSLEMVQQAFQMLDPTGSGLVNPHALREVASKLLHKDLDDDQLDSMMEFAKTMSHTEGEASSPEPRMVDVDAFCRLVARFGSPK